MQHGPVRPAVRPPVPLSAWWLASWFLLWQPFGVPCLAPGRWRWCSSSASQPGLGLFNLLPGLPLDGGLIVKDWSGHSPAASAVAFRWPPASVVFLSLIGRSHGHAIRGLRGAAFAPSG